MASTPAHNIRVPSDEWEALEREATKRWSSRSREINAFIRWTLGLPGAEMPQQLVSSDNDRK